MNEELATREELAIAERQLMAIQETINEHCDGPILSDFLGCRDSAGVFYGHLNLQDSVLIHIAEISIDLVILRLIEANQRMIEHINTTNIKLHKLQKELSKELE